MAEIWKQNENKSEEEDLVVTEHRDEQEPAVTPEEEQSVETTSGDPRNALEELGDDVASSPARRGTETSD
ncbi:hypothetical protein [Gulosibacter sediminis]|uniref:hypothetical protein n=1 Tax=Gulosibacter sediminis TaxID=1729695 RepID=UPI0024ACFF12|nr:hypothetical protein [Gulosibacter sediminis]